MIENFDDFTDRLINESITTKKDAGETEIGIIAKMPEFKSIHKKFYNVEVIDGNVDDYLNYSCIGTYDATIYVMDDDTVEIRTVGPVGKEGTGIKLHLHCSLPELTGEKVRRNKLHREKWVIRIVPIIKKKD